MSLSYDNVRGDDPRGHDPRSHDPYGAFRIADYRNLMGAWLLIGMTNRMQLVALGWDMYERTGSAMAIAWIGVSQFVPSLLLALPAGQMADRYDRRKLMMASTLVAALAALVLLVAAATEARSEWLYLGSFIGAAAQSLNRPARAALMTGIVPSALLPNAVAWSAGVNQCAAMAGPAIAGLAIALSSGALAAYAVVAAGSVAALALVLRIRPNRATVPIAASGREASGLQHLFAGMVHIVRTPVILGSSLLDMLVVMFGAAMGLLHIYAKDILQVGPSGLGWLASAPAVGAIVTVFVLNHLRPSPRPGQRFLWAVAAYGCATLVFALSTHFVLSLAALAIVGSMNSISVVTRHSLLQAYTPDELRGRVSSANGLFSGASSELGQFEAGALAALTTPVTAVVLGGCFTLAMTAIIAQRYPQLRELHSLTLSKSTP